jgi:drug/metabolite transporter (DMT)-like permease
MNIIKQNNASAFMALNAVLWGSSYIWSKLLLGHLPYFTLLFMFSLGGLLSILVIFKRRLKHFNKKTVITGCVLGSLSIMSNISCMLALGSTSSSNTAFIVQLSVVITPLMMAVAKKRLPDKRDALSAVTAMAGLVLLTCNFNDPGSFRFNIGDIYALANAIFFSLYLAVLKIYSNDKDPIQLTFVQHAASTAAFLCLMAVTKSFSIDYGNIDIAVAAVLAVSIFISVSTILIQISAIRYEKAEKAVVIYTLEPVTAAALAYIIMGERFQGVNAVVGSLLILLAVTVAVYRKKSIFRLYSKLSQKSRRISLRSQPSDALNMGGHSDGSSSLYT